jgi:putative transposase
MLIEDHIVMQMVKKVRDDHPGMGCRKVYHLIKTDLEHQQIKMGRDALFDLLASKQMLIRKRKRRYITTNSNHWYKKYPNLIRGLIPNGPNQLWVSDITYIKTRHNFLYLFLVTDAYSKKILGYRLAKDLSSRHAVNSLQDALKYICKPISGLIHHSDRGIQYCSKEYVSLLKDYSIIISMTENGDPLENSIAERVNGILKQEYINYELQQSNYISTTQLTHIIEIYNNKRPHLSCDMLTPQRAHLTSGKLKRRWKNYYKKEVNLNV